MVLKRNSQCFFSAGFCFESASHHFALFFFETGSLEGFVVLELPQYFLQRARKLAQAHLQPPDFQLQLISPDLSISTMP